MSAPVLRTRHWRWPVVLGLLVLLVGLAASYLAASNVASNDAAISKKTFTASAAQVTAALRLELAREQDLLIGATAFASDNPDLTSAQFDAWVAAVQAYGRYPELDDIGMEVIVPASELSTFASRAGAPSSGGGTSTLTITPPGQRSFYCLELAGSSRPGAAKYPPGYDICAGPLGASALAARDSGLSAVQPVTIGSSTLLVVAGPVYRAGSELRTAVARRENFLGWVGVVVDPNDILSGALYRRSGMGITLAYRSASSHAVFRTGRFPPGAQTQASSLGGGWTVKSFGVVQQPSITSSAASVAVLVSGVVLTASLVVLVLVLSVTRLSALRRVDRQIAELRRLALHDALTDLPNRRLLIDRAEQLLRLNRRAETYVACLYMDVDHFKAVNDQYGHDAGDALLQAVANRLRTNLREADTIARLGGDEFVVLMSGVISSQVPIGVAARALELLREPYILPGVETHLTVSCSIGVAVGDRPQAEDLLRDADLALYEAKEAGRDRYATYQENMTAQMERRSSLHQELRHALEHDEFRLVYQPIYRLDDLTPVGFEALVRWESPTLGQVNPEEFVPLLEESGLITDVGRSLLMAACKQLTAWGPAADGLTMAVNLSGRQLDDESIVDDVANVIRESGIVPPMLTLEITETALMRDVEETMRRLREMKELGIRIAIDDFGTGYSSLAYLQRFPVDFLKIDRSFTEAVTTSIDTDRLARALVSLGHDLGLRIIAEGVETIAQVDWLREQRVDDAQGFLFSKPLSAEHILSRVLRPSAEPGGRVRLEVR